MKMLSAINCNWFYQELIYFNIYLNKLCFQHLKQLCNMSLWRLQSQHGGGVSVMKLDHHYSTFELTHDKTNKLTCAPSEDSNQPGHPPSLIRVFAVRSIDS